MFDAERLLGQLVGDALGGRWGGGKRRRKSHKGGLGGLMGGMSGGTKARIGIGLLGLAYAAYEHYSQQGPASTAARSAVTPPPPPGADASPPPPPPGVAVAGNEQALHLVRAMVCAADADGLVDAAEREGILTRAREAGLSEADIAALDVEIRAPMTLAQLVVRTPADLRDETYGAALIAITTDTEAERGFLDRLASELQLDEGARHEIHAQLGLA